VNEPLKTLARAHSPQILKELPWDPLRVVASSKKEDVCKRLMRGGAITEREFDEL
jgi:hypothetical protein